MSREITTMNRRVLHAYVAAYLCFGIGLLAPLTPSPGEVGPTLPIVLFFTVMPIALLVFAIRSSTTAGGKIFGSVSIVVFATVVAFLAQMW